MRTRGKVRVIVVGAFLGALLWAPPAAASVTWCTSGYVDGYPENVGSVGFHTQYLGCLGNTTQACIDSFDKARLFPSIACFI